MKKARNCIIYLLIFIGLMGLTSVPLKMLEWWVRVNGFSARGFSGSLLGHLHIERFGDENSKRSFDLVGVDIKYTFWPKLIIRELNIDKVYVRRTSPVATRFIEMFPKLIESLSRPIRVRSRPIRVDKVKIHNVEIYLSKDTDPIRVDDLNIANVVSENGRIELGKIIARGESLQIEDNGQDIVCSAVLPKELYSDLNENLVFKLVLTRRETLEVTGLRLWDVANVRSGLETDLAPEPKWMRYFINKTDAQIAFKLVAQAKL